MSELLLKSIYVRRRRRRRRRRVTTRPPRDSVSAGRAGYEV